MLERKKQKKVWKGKQDKPHAQLQMYHLTCILNLILFHFKSMLSTCSFDVISWFCVMSISICCSVLLICCHVCWNPIQPNKPQLLTSSAQVDDQAPVENRAASQSLGSRDRVHSFQTHTYLGTKPCTGSAVEPIGQRDKRKHWLENISRKCVHDKMCVGATNYNSCVVFWTTVIFHILYD